jgi:hypothetical protein
MNRFFAAVLTFVFAMMPAATCHADWWNPLTWGATRHSNFGTSDIEFRDPAKSGDLSWVLAKDEESRVDVLADLPASREDVRKLMQVNQADKAALAALEGSMNQLAKSLPAEKAEVLKRVARRVCEEHLDELLDSCIDAYMGKFSKADIEQMINFLSSPAGKKMIKVMPEVVRDSAQAGIRFGSRLGPIIDQELQREGF